MLRWRFALWLLIIVGQRCEIKAGTTLESGTPCNSPVDEKCLNRYVSL
jgi:hypothetical protein